MFTMDVENPVSEPMIREARVDDAPALAALSRHVQAIHLAERPEYFAESSDDELSEWFHRRLGEADFRAWLAEVNGYSAGYVALVIRERSGTPFSRPRTFGEVDQIGVVPEFRGRGVGRALLGRVVNEARRIGIEQIELNAWAFNREAQDFFQRSGFTAMTVRFTRRSAES